MAVFCVQRDVVSGGAKNKSSKSQFSRFLTTTRNHEGRKICFNTYVYIFDVTIF